VSEWRGEDAVRHHIATNYAQQCVAQVAGPLRWISYSAVWWADVGRTADIANVTQFLLSEILP
jgi:hypothetical protein